MFKVLVLCFVNVFRQCARLLITYVEYIDIINILDCVMIIIRNGGTYKEVYCIISFHIVKLYCLCMLRGRYKIILILIITRRKIPH